MSLEEVVELLNKTKRELERRIIESRRHIIVDKEKYTKIKNRLCMYNSFTEFSDDILFDLYSKDIIKEYANSLEIKHGNRTPYEKLKIQIIKHMCDVVNDVLGKITEESL